MPKTKTFLKKVYQCQATCFVRRDIPPAIHCQYRYKSAPTVANACNILKFQKKQFGYVTFCQLNGSRKSTVKRPLTFAEVSSNSPAIDPQILHQLVGLCNFQNPNDHCENGLVEKANFSQSFTFPSSAIAVCNPSMTLAGMNNEYMLIYKFYIWIAHMNYLLVQYKFYDTVILILKISFDMLNEA